MSTTEQYFLGIDIGSLTCDGVIIDKDENIVAQSVILTGAKNIEAINDTMKTLLNKSGLSERNITSLVSTGYGRERVSNKAASVTEISCHAKGFNKLYPDVRLIIDIGGQDSKAIKIGPKGNVLDFAMNDKCAAGTGRFLEAMARALQVDLTELKDLDIGVTGNLTLSSICTVFAESEVVSLIAEGVSIKEIAYGLNRAIASRTNSLVKRICQNVENVTVGMSGGVARNSGVVRALNQILSKTLVIPETPDIIGALGAALFAKEKFSTE